MDVLQNHNLSIFFASQDGLRKTHHTYPKSECKENVRNLIRKLIEWNVFDIKILEIVLFYKFIKKLKLKD